MFGAALALGGLSLYQAYEANKTADAQAKAANYNNKAAADHSRLLAEQDSRERQDSLLKKFKIKAGEVKDSVDDIKQATAVSLSNLDMEILKAKSITDNTNASRHIEGRLTQRLQASIDIQGDLQQGSITQNAQQQTRSVNDKLVQMRRQLESQQENISVDYDNAINQANNNEIRNISYSHSTGTLGIISSGIAGASMGMALTSSYYGMQAAESNYNTSKAIGGINA